MARDRWAQLSLLPGFIIVSPRIDLFCAPVPATFEFRKYRFELARKLAKQLDQIQGVLECQGSPLSSARAHGMRGVADKNHAILVPRREWWGLIDVRFTDGRRVGQKRPIGSCHLS